METELLPLLLRINLVLAAAIALVLALRAPVRRWCGARVAYALWLLPLVAAAMCFAPARVEHVVLEASAFPVTAAASAPEPPYLMWAWASGALLSLVVLAARQWRFTHALGRLRTRDDLGANVRAAESSTHGPAVLGVLRPLIVTPADFEARFDPEEQSIVLAHERAHVAQGDPIINAVVVVMQCVNWFNPLIYIGARALRMDQELACDAAVLERAGAMRRRYAEAMLKTHVAAAAPLGCAWPPANLNALKERISMLKQTLPSRTQRLLGGAAIVTVTAAAAAAAWAAQPARVITRVVEAAPVERVEHVHVHELTLEGEDDVRVEVRAEAGERSMRRVVVRDGEVISERDLTPAEEAEIRAAVEEARRATSEAREAIRDAQAHLREHQRQLSESERAEIRAAIREARETMANAQVSAELSAEQREQVRAAMAQARAALDERRIELAASHASREEVRAAIARARVEMEAARAQLAELPRLSAELAQMPDIRQTLDDAGASIRREAQEARAEGDLARAEELERAAQSLERRVQRREERDVRRHEERR